MQKRVSFDFEIYFTNGGGIKGEGFRLDIAGDDISDKELADYIVSRHAPAHGGRNPDTQ